MVSLLSLMFIVSMLPLSYSQPTPQRGPKMDILRQKVVKSPDAVLIDLIQCELDFAPDLIRPADIETLDSEGFTITSAPGFHMGHIGINIRADQSYRGRPEVGPVLSDVNFRHALFACYDQDTIVASIYKYIVTPVRSLVPPAQGGWVNPAVPRVAYNPGDPMASTVYNPATGDNADACSILRYGGYTYSAARDNWITPYDLDGDTVAGETNGDDDIPEMRCFTPTYEVAPTSAEHGARWTTVVNSIGVPVIHEPAEFSPYLTKVFGSADFDMYMVFWSLGRFPDHLYDMLHSSQDCQYYPWRYNAPGVDDPTLDVLLDTIKFSLDHDAKMDAAWEVQERLYDENYPLSAFSYMQLYSRVYFCAFKPGLRGIVNSPGYGADNSWSYLNMYWEAGHPNERLEDGKEVIVYQLGEEPELLNPCYSHTVYAWQIVGAVLDGLMAVNPYTHEDVPWLAESWSTEEWSGTVTLDSENRYLGVPAGGTVAVTGGMNVTFTLNSTVEWQDGNPYTPSDAEFNLEFLRNNQIPRYTSMWQHAVDVQVLDATTFVVVSDTTSQWLLYDFAADAALLPPPVWAPLDGKPLNEILDYDPGANLTKPTGAGPRFGTDACPTQLYGTGPFVFVYYDPVAQFTDQPASRYYFKSTDEIAEMKTEMFHNCGDVDSDGEVWATDKTRYSAAFGYADPAPEYDADADITGPAGTPDGKVNAWDGVLISFFWGDQKENP
jgi:peptide/nickel transport system substrate-binding protein